MTLEKPQKPQKKLRIKMSLRFRLLDNFIRQVKERNFLVTIDLLVDSKKNSTIYTLQNSSPSPQNNQRERRIDGE